MSRPPGGRWCALLLATICASAGCAIFKRKSAPRTRGPNIVFILADDLGYGHLGSYGQRVIRTPELDRMAREGTRFTQYYAGSSVCAPSRSVLMTGFHAGHTSVRATTGGIPLLEKDLTVATLLRRVGYRSAAIGKWGLGDIGSKGVPWAHGFDEFFGYLHQVHAHFHYPLFLWQGPQKLMLTDNDRGQQRQYTHDLFTERAVDFIRRHQDQPFFLYLAYTIPHPELLVPGDSLRQYEGQFPESNPYVGRHYAPQPKPRTTLAAMISRLDRDVGRLLATLKELNLDERTIVFFTSDNGATDEAGSDLQFFRGNGPLGGKKGTLHEGGIRVPMIVRWPGQVPAEATSDFPWGAWDVLPTLLDLAGFQAPAGIDGRSRAPTLLGRPQDSAPYLYWEAGLGLDLQQAVRAGNWKAIRTKPTERWALYDLSQDPGEERDVAGLNPHIVAQMSEHAMHAHAEPRPYPAEPPTERYDRRQTGYVR